MLVKVFEVSLLPDYRRPGIDCRWPIVANSMQSAWAKFCRRFGPLKPDPELYDVCLLRTEAR